VVDEAIWSGEESCFSESGLIKLRGGVVTYGGDSWPSQAGSVNARGWGGLVAIYSDMSVRQSVTHHSRYVTIECHTHLDTGRTGSVCRSSGRWVRRMAGRFRKGKRYVSFIPRLM